MYRFEQTVGLEEETKTWKILDSITASPELKREDIVTQNWKDNELLYAFQAMRETWLERKQEGWWYLLQVHKSKVKETN